ncbi:contact-dependent growth inhibition system immunity protein [Streptomyces sp. Da 82-17]|uniref:contact-dependent growth inhibition system immunity protein n=1 Tax=Streptomyces sp. Da 82-17 TaxID=3377116 RepID=UPI0038D43658
MHLDRALDDLDPPCWGRPDEGATGLVRTVHALRGVRLGELTPADVRTLVSQRVALPFVLPLAVRLLLGEPLLDAYFYEGDLLLATVEVPPEAWRVLPGLAVRLCAVVAALPEGAVAELPRGAADVLARFTAQHTPTPTRGPTRRPAR